MGSVFFGILFCFFRNIIFEDMKNILIFIDFLVCVGNVVYVGILFVKWFEFRIYFLYILVLLRVWDCNDSRKMVEYE